ncbi:MAG: transcription antitermination factor NusB [Novosphingopyxis baekryungensis]|jgi:N utilization substance protein B|uniref:transcription antitermination factor NusB n=1 Tax=Novosphingopyxis baekryungensis TaxID=279369 RepID=UPI0003B3C9ED|nr:transcription antitermination factor NusB [Novosphingopyxis baekryungensis]MDE0933246.1 transcription antitermination factor NusB [Novosphingopyxis baekryungensis]
MSNTRSQPRSAARLAAVQALYQKDMEGLGIARLLREFHEHRLGEAIEEEPIAEAEPDFFDDVVTGVDARRDEIDILIGVRLADGWKLERLDKTMLQVLRCGTYELLARADVPTGAIVNEYVDVAHAFFDEKDAKFVNGLLDAISKDVRKGE